MRFYEIYFLRFIITGWVWKFIILPSKYFLGQGQLRAYNYVILYEYFSNDSDGKSFNVTVI